MKLFQQLLVAPAALGLLAPMSVDAAEVNFKGISDYAPATQEFKAASELSDIHPTDWTFQALTEIRNSRGCNVALPTGVITRTEAAAVLNKCIGDASQLNEAELRLVDEFAPELATIKGNSDLVNNSVFEAGSFSSTTVLGGNSNMNFGAVNQSANEELQGNYELKYKLSSSFTGEDNLIAVMELGNSPSNSLGIYPESSKGTTGSGSAKGPELTDLYYAFPFKGTTVCVGALMDGDACLAGTYTAYGEKVYNGANDYWAEGVGNGTAIGINKVFDNGWNVSGNIQGASQGVLAAGSDNFTGQVGYDGDGYGGAITYSDFDGDDTAYGIGVYFTNEGWPTISVGYDKQDSATAGADDTNSFIIGASGDVGPGTLGGSWQSIETLSGTSAKAKASYEVYYDYSVNDNVTVTPSLWIVEDNGAVATDDTTGYALTVGFKF